MQVIFWCVAQTRFMRRPEKYVRQLRERLNREFPGTMIYFPPADIMSSQTLNFGLPAPFDLQIVGRDQAGNRAIAVKLAEQIKKIPGRGGRAGEPAGRLAAI